MFVDQFISLAANDELLSVICKLIKKRIDGTFHVASRDRFTPHVLTKYLLFRLLGKKVAVGGSSIVDYLRQNGVSFGQYSGLSVKKTEKMLGVEFSLGKE